MRRLRLARRLLVASALVLLAGLGLSVMTQDAWLHVGHAAGVISAVTAVIALMLLLIHALKTTSDARRGRR